MTDPNRLTTFRLALMTAAAIVSLRGLPMMAREELTMFAYILFATLLFLLPAALVAAELGGAFPERGGGVYTWVKEAFNRRLGFVAIFLQWIQNVVWYPTVLGFAAAAAAYLTGEPALADDGRFVGLFSIVMYWAATLLTLRGTEAVAAVTSRGFLVGTLVPGIAVILLTGVWLATGGPDALQHLPATARDVVAGSGGHLHPRLFPHVAGLGDIAFLAGILLLFAGVEVHAVHAPELQHPQRQFPRAMFLAAAISVGLFTLGALAVAIVTPYGQIDLQSGLFIAFDTLFGHLGMGWMTRIMGLLTAFGTLAGVMSWISGPSRGLLWTSREGLLPRSLRGCNRHGIPVRILVLQGVLVTLLSSLYFVMKDVSVAFFLLSALTIGLYLIMYMMMYAAAIRLRYTQPDRPRSYRIPGGMTGMWAVAGTGFLAELFAFAVCFFPPSQLPVGTPALYTGLVAGGTLLFLAIPFAITRRTARNPPRPAPDGKTPECIAPGNSAPPGGDRSPQAKTPR